MTVHGVAVNFFIGRSIFRPHIRVILLADTEQPRVTVWRRGEAGWRHGEEAGLEAAIELPEIDARLPLADLCDGMAFED